MELKRNQKPLFAVFDAPSAALASIRPTPTLTISVAQRIIALAKNGEHDPERLCEGALQAV
jgi:hypothetical protein